MFSPLTKETEKYANDSSFLGIRQYQNTLTLYCFYKKLQDDGSLEHAETAKA